MNPVFEFLNGKTYKLYGVSGTFEHKITESVYPTRRTVESLYHNPDAKGRRTTRYQETKRLLGDDHTTDLTSSIDTYCEIACELGYC